MSKYWIVSGHSRDHLTAAVQIIDPIYCFIGNLPRRIHAITHSRPSTPDSLMSVSTSPWTETARSARTTWGGRSSWWRRWSKSSLAWWTSAATSCVKSRGHFRFSSWDMHVVVAFLMSSLMSIMQSNATCVLSRLRPQDTDQRTRLWKHLQGLLETYSQLRENDQSFLVEVDSSACRLLSVSHWLLSGDLNSQLFCQWQKQIHTHHQDKKKQVRFINLFCHLANTAFIQKDAQRIQSELMSWRSSS